MPTDLRETPHRDDELLLALLNSTPVADGVVHDRLADEELAIRWIATLGGEPGELAAVRRTRDALQTVVRGERQPTVLADALRNVRQIPQLDDDGLRWSLETPPRRQLAARAVLAWAALQEDLPGRLRACANDECRLFLLDRSRANSARWCSMATCGNRLKARRHHARVSGG